MQAFTGTLAKQVTILPNVIFSAIKLPTSDKPIQLVGFVGKCPNKAINALKGTIGSQVTILGRMKTNKKTGQLEIIVEGAK
jgi:hypothetical protein